MGHSMTYIFIYSISYSIQKTRGFQYGKPQYLENLRYLEVLLGCFTTEPEWVKSVWIMSACVQTHTIYISIRK